MKLLPSTLSMKLQTELSSGARKYLPPAGCCRSSSPSPAFSFSIEECRELLSLYEDRDRSSADVKSMALKRLAEIEDKLRDLSKLRDELSHLAEACRGDGRPDCPIIDNFAGGEL